jgi:hypothetical protein
MTERPPCRLFAILAREGPVAVILRRGPSKWVRLIKWNTDTDTLERGHWFHGRIYEWGCDLSPDGSLFVYNATKFNSRTLSDTEYTYAWTAISRPPWLTALALWPEGDCWGGGGSFIDDRTVCLHRLSHTAPPHPDHLPQGLTIVSAPCACAEYKAVCGARPDHASWLLRQQMKRHEISYGYATDCPEISSKRHPALGINLLRSVSERKYETVNKYSLEDCEGGEQRNVVGATWADFDQRGRLVFAGGGRLFAADLSSSMEFAPVEIADFNDDEPVQIEPPEWARVW